MVNGAVYDAVNGITRTHGAYLVTPRSNPWDSQDAAAATAAYRVLAALFPAQQPSLQVLYAASLAAVPDGPAEAGGIAAGEEAAAAMLAARSNDGRGGQFNVVVGTAPGAWRPTPPVFLLDPAPWLANVKPFVIPNAELLRSRGPRKLTSAAYARDFAEVKELGSVTSTARTADQTDTALYWNDPTIWARLLGSLAGSEKLSTDEAARMLAMANLAGADAAIACWDDKYHWSFWRPVTAIREAASDGNRATEPDPGWTPLLATPPFPEHPSGHACTSSAVVHTLQRFFRRDEASFSAFSMTSRSTRSFTSFSQALDEVIDARVWSGIHFRTADEQGAKIGKDVARIVRKNLFQRLRCK
jgi:hypothetical protein